MTFAEFLPQLDMALRGFSLIHRMAFSASCCERALLNPENYAKDVERVDAVVVGKR